MAVSKNNKSASAPKRQTSTTTSAPKRQAQSSKDSDRSDNLLAARTEWREAIAASRSAEAHHLSRVQMDSQGSAVDLDDSRQAMVDAAEVEDAARASFEELKRNGAPSARR